MHKNLAVLLIYKAKLMVLNYAIIGNFSLEKIQWNLSVGLYRDNDNEN